MGNAHAAPQLDEEPGNLARPHKRQYKGRHRRVEVLYTEEEYAELEAGAVAAGWTVAGWLAVSGLSASRLVLAGPWTAPE